MLTSHSITPTSGRRALVAIAAAVLSLLAFAQSVAADAVIAEGGEGAGQVSSPEGLAVDTSTGEPASGRLYVADSANHRVDVFDAAGKFAMAFGWGVVNGAGELQVCGPLAPVPTATCRKGLEGGGAGEFSSPEEVAVDNSGSASRHDVYVLDRDESVEEGGGYGDRVEGFTPTGEFVLTWGGGVITAGAAGTGNLSAGSTEISNVVTTERVFEAGQTILAAGKIPADTTIVAVGAGTITLSKPALASGTGVALSVAAGSSNVPVNEVQEFKPGSSGPFQSAEIELEFSTPEPSPTSASTNWMPVSSSAKKIQEELEALSNIGAGNVKVSGPQGGPFLVEFKGSRFENTNVKLLRATGTVETIPTAIQNGDSHAEICTAAIAANCAGGVEGSGDGQFDDSMRGTTELAVGPGGTVYVADCVPTGLEFKNYSPVCKDRVQEFEPSGVLIKALPLPQEEQLPLGLAVDSSGDFYISTQGEIHSKYDQSGNLLETVSGFTSGLAVDPSDDLFASEASTVAEYDSGGSTLRRFGYGVTGGGAFEGLAPYHSATGDIYVSLRYPSSRVLHLSFPPPGPLILPAPCKTSFLGNSKATLEAEVNPEGNATTAHFQYVTDQAFAENVAEGGDGFSGAHPAISTPESSSIGSDFFPHKASVPVAVVPETKYHCRVVATNAEAPGGVDGEEGTFTSLPPLQIEATWSSEVGIEGATLNAEVNPLGISATGYFEYVDETTFQADTKLAEEEGKSPMEVQEAGFEHAVKAPAAPIGFGEAESPKAGAAVLSGLVPGTSYRYRVVATDVLVNREIPGPTESVRTYLAGAGGLPDGRAYEMVSPPQKNSGEVGVGEGDGGAKSIAFYALIDAGATSGEAITYTSWTSFGGGEGAPGTSQYLSKRTGSGWQTENISPFGLERVLIPPYRGFDPELGRGALVVSEPALTSEASEGIDNLYLRNSQTGALQALTDEQPTLSFFPGKAGEFCLDYAGSSADGTRAFFAANASYAGAPTPTFQKFNLYEWSSGGLRPVSVLPGQSAPVAPTAGDAFGAAGGHCETGEKIVRHAISADGSRVFWTYAPNSGASELLVRVEGSETLQLDKKVAGGAGSSGEGVFQGASTDGSKAFFTDVSKLEGGASEGDLYLYELPGKELKDLTPGTEAADVNGVAGISDDGSYVYFVAEGVLTGTEADVAGEKAVKGADNLYVYHEGEGVRFIARLNNREVDQGDWSSNPSGLTARVTPDGRHLAFVSLEAQALAGYDNTISASAHCQLPNHKGGSLQGSPACPEVFVYDAESKVLSCASCDPTGARPLGPSSLPGWSNPYEGPRYLSDNGSRLYFETFDALTLADTNRTRDVYEFERPGEGSCTAAYPSFDPGADGCHFLISTGTSTDESYFLDASGSGRDAFFSTRQSLVAADGDENYDIYDARVGGGFASQNEPFVREICEGLEACRSPLSEPPVQLLSGSAALVDSGNLAVAPEQSEPKHSETKPSSKCKKGFVRKKGKCVKQRRVKHRTKRRKRGKKGRAGR